MKGIRLNTWFVLLLVCAALLTISVESLFAATDVTDKVQINKGRMLFDRRTSENFFDASLTNISEDILLAPIRVVIDSISLDTVTIANADGYTEDGKPYFEYTTGNGQLAATETVPAKSWRFSNPRRARFNFAASVWGVVPEAAALIGPEGGVVEITDPGSPLHDVQIIFQEGTFTEGSHVAVAISSSLSSCQPADSLFITPQIRISSTSPVNRFVTIRLPVSSPFSLDDFILVLHKTDGVEFWTPLPVKWIGEGGYIEFETRYFSTFAGISYVDLDPLTKFNMMELYHPYIYDSLMREIKIAEAVIKNSNEFNEAFKGYIDFSATVGGQLLTGIALANPGLSDAELNILVKESLVNLTSGSLHLLYQDDELLFNLIDTDYAIDAWGCLFGLAVAHGNALNPLDIGTAYATCGIDAINHIFQTSANIWNTIEINSAIKKHNEFWIVADYLKVYYYYNGDLEKIAEHINYEGEVTEENLINEAALFYKRGWFAGNDYDMDEVLRLVSNARNFISQKRLELDADNDFIAQYADKCPDTYNPNQEDFDADGVGDACDNCPDTPNPLQIDSDKDDIGDACETPDALVQPTLNTPHDNASFSNALAIPFMWTDDANPANTLYCLTISNRGADLQSPDDDVEVYDTCFGNGTVVDWVDSLYYQLPSNTLSAGTDYTWTVRAVNEGGDMSDPSVWWNFSTAPENSVHTDSDGDGILDISDQCPGTPNTETADVDATGCSPSQLDTDSDGVTDNNDLCSGTPQGVPVGADGCPIVDPLNTDNDGDGFTENEGDCNDTPGAGASIYPGAREVCDGVINNCSNLSAADGSDETWFNQDYNCGVGACAGIGTRTCQNGVQVNTCSPGTPTTEICGDGIDQDCNGSDLECPVISVPIPGNFHAEYQSINDWNYLTWNDVPGADEYRIYWGTGPEVTTGSNQLSQPVTSPYGHSGVLPGWTYYYKIMAVVDGIESELSSVVSVAVPGNVPQNVQVTYQPAHNWNYITWNAVPGATGYHVYWGTETGVTAGSEELDPTTTADYGHTGVLPGSMYCYRVSSVAGGIESNLSEEVCHTVPVNGQTFFPLNDTGITWGGDYPSGNNPDCTGVEIGAQDCSHGRDVTHNDDSDGHAGFSFTKLDSNGIPLADQHTGYLTTPWACVQDNVTGLIWEVKTDDGGLHDRNDAYTWYNTNPAANGGADGYADSRGIICYGYDPSDPATFCNTQAYVARFNAQGLCGASNWRMPTRKELQGIVSYDRVNPAIDTDYFPNTPSSYVWSGSPSAGHSSSAWGVGFGYGYSSGDGNGRYGGFQVRLVRDGQ